MSLIPGLYILVILNIFNEALLTEAGYNSTQSFALVKTSASLYSIFDAAKDGKY